jgi:hypothetical protein
MASGSVPLLEAAKSGSNQLKLGVVETYIQESPLLEMLPWRAIQGNALKSLMEENLPTASFRDVNETYTRSWGTDTEHFWGVAIMGGEVFIDNALVRFVANEASVKAKQFAKHAKAHALTFDRTFFDGTGNSKDFKGVNTLINEGFGQVYAPHGGTGGTLTLDNLDVMLDTLRTGSASALLMNRTLRRKVTFLARSFNTGVTLLDVGTDALGRQVTKYNDVPIRIIGEDETHTAILGFDEANPANSTGTIASSIYGVRFGDDFVTGLLGAGGHMEVVDFGETQAAPGHLGRIEWYPGIAIFDAYSIVRYGGITNT